MRRWLFAVLVCSGCFRSFDAPGPYQCEPDGTCGGGLTCDDGVCCRPGGTPACPTLPIDGVCLTGAPGTYYRDQDGDGFGAGPPITRCAQPRGFVKPEVVQGQLKLDCDDGTDGAAINPLARERCNGLDDDCDGALDNGLTPRTTWYPDVDGDGFGQPDSGLEVAACAQPRGYAARGGDCAPTQAQVFPGAPERCNDEDDNCNGAKDEAPLVDAESPGVPGSPTVACMRPNAGRCTSGGIQCLLDRTTQRYAKVCVSRAVPAFERCDGLDNDCDGVEDNPPACGGPKSLVDAGSVQYGAERLALAAGGLPQTCLKGLAGAEAQSWFNPSWVGSRGGQLGTSSPIRHTWWVEAAPNETWDLSTMPRLVLAVRETSGLGGSFFTGPIVTLCGKTATDFLRFTPSMNELRQGGTLNVSVLLDGGTPDWAVERRGAFSASEVLRLEVTVSPVPREDGGVFNIHTFSIAFLPNAGFVR